MVYWGHDKGDFLCFLGGCGQEALAFDAYEASVSGVAMAMKLFGVSEGAFDCFFSSFVDGLVIGGGEALCIISVACFLPDTAGQGALSFGV
jgi:hypothetical protein